MICKLFDILLTLVYQDVKNFRTARNIITLLKVICILKPACHTELLRLITSDSVIIDGQVTLHFGIEEFHENIRQLGVLQCITNLYRRRILNCKYVVTDKFKMEHLSLWLFSLRLRVMYHVQNCVIAKYFYKHFHMASHNTLPVNVNRVICTYTVYMSY